MSAYLDDFLPGSTIRKMVNSSTTAGASVDLATNGTISVYKDGGLTQSTAGVTFTEQFDGLVGVHKVEVATTDSFYTPFSEYEVVLSGSTIDGVTVNASLFSFSIENRSAAGLIVRGFASAGSFDTIVMAALSDFADNTLRGATARVIHGTGKGQSRPVDSFSGTTLHVSPALDVQLDTTSAVEVFNTSPSSSDFPTDVHVRKVANLTLGLAGTGGQMIGAV